MPVIVSGNTFHCKEYLKSLGARWNNIKKSWTLDFLHDVDRVLLRQRGVTIHDTERPAPHRAMPSEWNKRQKRETVIIGDDPTYVNYFAEQNPRYHFGFSSLRKFTDYVATIEPEPHWPFTNPWFVKDAAGTHDMPHAIRLARYGWLDGLGLVPKLRVPDAEAKRRYHSVAGGSVNVGRMLAGNPAHMRNRRIDKGKENITLFVDFTNAKRVANHHIIMRALIVGSMVDLLETCGYRCNIIAVSNGKTFGVGASDHFTIRIKDAYEPLNLLDLTFALGHPSMGGRFRNACVAQFADELGLDNKFSGLCDDPFTDEHKPKENEFYIPYIHPMMQAQLSDDPLDMLRFLEPEGLPIKLRKDDD